MAGRIADRVVREVVDRSDMDAVVGDVVKLTRAGKEWRGLCPFHGEKTASFYVNGHTKVYMCHGCSAGGDVVQFVREIRGLTFVEAVEWLAERAGIRIEREDVDPQTLQRQLQERSQRARLLELNGAALRWFQATLQRPAGQKALRYATDKRGLSPEAIDRFGIGCAPDAWDGLCTFLESQGFAAEDVVRVGLAAQRQGGGLYDRFRDRLMFPIYSTAGDLVAFGGRDLANQPDAAKYINSPESELSALEVEHNNRLWTFFKKSHVVFGLWQARGGIRRLRSALVVEGNLDVITLHQAGFDNAVAPMGTAMTQTQLAELRRFTERVILCMDGDKAGRAATMKVIPLALAAGLDGKVVWLERCGAKDPDELVRTQGAAALQSLVDGADDLITAFVDAAIGEWDGTITGRVEVGRRVESVLATIPNPMTRELARQQLQTRLQIPLEVQRELARTARPLVFDDEAGPGEDPRAASRPIPRSSEPKPPRKELDLAEAAMWYPGLLLELVRSGGLDLVSHQGLRTALGELCTRAEAAGAADTHMLRGWLMALPDSEARRALLGALVQTPRVEEASLPLHVETVLDGLELDGLLRSQAELRARVRAGVGSLDQDARTVFDISNRIEALKRRRQSPGQPLGTESPRPNGRGITSDSQEIH